MEEVAKKPKNKSAAHILGVGVRAAGGSSAATEIPLCPTTPPLTGGNYYSSGAITEEQITEAIKKSGALRDMSDAALLAKTAIEVLAELNKNETLENNSAIFLEIYDLIGGLIESASVEAEKSGGDFSFESFVGDYFIKLISNYANRQSVYDPVSGVFCAPVFEKQRFREIKEIQYRLFPAKISSGDPCINPNCRSTRTMELVTQNRSADEASVTFVTCLDCGKKYKRR